jgi:pimeloyl-ACP methyl ester carboxylesterase
VLVLVGDKDRITPPEHSELIAQTVAGAELVVLPGAGHMLQLEQPEQTTRHLRALVRRAAAAHRRPA